MSLPEERVEIISLDVYLPKDVVDMIYKVAAYEGITCDKRLFSVIIDLGVKEFLNRGQNYELS